MLGSKPGQENFSPLGSGALENSETPAITPRSFFTGQPMLLLGPPRVPRSMGSPNTHRVACSEALPVKFEEPIAQPRLLIVLPELTEPPRLPS